MSYILDKFYNTINDKTDVDVILSGHDHDQQHICIPKKPHLFISGTGGKTRKCEERDNHTKYLKFLVF